ncbi:MAG TPA: cation:proton antiporter [Gemmatimonadaceae bacterium]|nr:cation:proton antiporter [Gemmatimonadaceae bacterium]
METGHFPSVLAALVATLIATKLFGELAQRIRQPAVLGELLAGIVLGGSLLGVLDPSDPVMHALGELGVLVLLFEIGLHTDLRSLVRVGGSATAVGLVGVALPFALGDLAARQLGLSPMAALVAGAALTATSIGISARVLADLGQLDRPEGQIVLGAAVLDDVVGLVILSVVSTIAAGAGVSVGGIAVTAAVAVGFIAAAILVGQLLAPPVFRWVDQLEQSGALGVMALAFAFLLAWVAWRIGSAMIIGAFAAGLVVHRTPQRHGIERATASVGYLVVPIFFAVVGAQVDLRSLLDRQVLLVGGVLVIVAVVGKFAAGYAPVWFRGDKALIGVAMIPRGEVGLIFAQMGLTEGVLDAGMFSAITMMVVVTTFAAPIALGRMARRTTPRTEQERAGDGGIDDLVAGARASPDDARSGADG